MNLGDTIYADQPLLAEVKLDDGSKRHPNELLLTLRAGF